MGAFHGPDGGSEELIRQVKSISRPLRDEQDLDPLMDQIGDARFVLLGEASHGTSDYYTWRARISQRLIEGKGFAFIAVEGDWPDCYRVNRYIKGYPDSGDSADQVLHEFERWPTWMWANWEIVALTEWMREFNKGRQEDEKVGFYGLDVYSLWESMDAIMKYLEENDSEAVQLAKQAYRCFEPYGEDVQSYAWSTRMVPDTCEDEVVDLLMEMRKRTEQFKGDHEEQFNAEQNALVLVNAERYYRAMVRSDSNSWNVRDYHMADTLDRLMEHTPKAKAIVWAHNTHVGDARATDMQRAGMVNIGQLVRERHSNMGVVLVGSGSYKGSVIAGEEWGAPMERMPVPEAQAQSWEDVLHRAGSDDKFLSMKTGALDSEELREVRGHRAIGVVYNPSIERFGNYVPTVLPARYDAFLYVDETEALHPLHMQPELAEVPETYPWGL